VTITTAKGWRALCYGAGRGFVALAYSTADYMASSNGASWSQGSSAFSVMFDVAYSPTLDKFVAVGDSSTIQYASGSGFPSLSWTAITVGSGVTWSGITWDSLNSQFVACGFTFSSGVTATSSNGTTWSSTHNAGIDLRGIASAS
jgi:hypothetical protein